MSEFLWILHLPLDGRTPPPVNGYREFQHSFCEPWTNKPYYQAPGKRRPADAFHLEYIVGMAAKNC
jgi:hypothetical protein